MSVTRYMTVTTTQENQASPIVSGPGYRYLASRAKCGVDTGVGIDTGYQDHKRNYRASRHWLTLGAGHNTPD